MVLILQRNGRPRRVVDVSVVIPVYKHERFLETALRSVLEQSVEIREIVCIDDGSSDGSFAVAREMSSAHSKIRCWTRPNEGANRTINEGIEASEGALVAILNSDDVFEPDRVERCLRVFDADPDAAVVCSGISFIDADGNPTSNGWYDDALAFYRCHGDLAAALINANFVMTTSNIVARRAVFRQVGPFDDLRYAHDLDFLLRLVTGGHRTTIVRSNLLRYRYHGSNTISEAHDGVRWEVAAVVAAFVRRCRDSGGPLPGGSDAMKLLWNATDDHGLTESVNAFLLSPPPKGDPRTASSYLRPASPNEP